MRRLASIAVLAACVWGGAAASAAPTLGGGSAITYTEAGAAVAAAPNFTASGGGSYVNGSLQFAIGSSTSTETLALTTVTSPDTTSGAVSIVGTTVYVGNGTSADPVGTVDSTANGQAGQPLKINFTTSAFANSSFEDGTTNGWTISNSRVIINGTNTIDGFVIPSDPTPQPSNGARVSAGDANSATMTFTSAISNNVAAGGVNGTNSLSLNLSGSVSPGGGVVRGPSAVSASSFRLSAGNVISFWWSAAAAGDAYDVFGYLLNVDNGHTQILINATGASGSATQAWTKVTATAAESGNYKFVFISGSFDFSFGSALGAKLLIDNVQLESGTIVDDAIVQALGRLVTYRDTSPNPATSRSITISATNGANETATTTQPITVTLVNNAPTLSGLAAFTYTPQAAAAIAASAVVADDDDTTLASAAVSITTNRASGDALALTVDGATMGGIVASYDGGTGVLTLSGTATLAQYQSALRAVTFATTSTSAAARTFSFSITDSAATAPGQKSATGTVTVSLTAPAPTITSAATASGTYGASFSYAITASSLLEVTGYSASGLPAGLSVSTTTGAITGTPTQTGTFSVTVGAANAANSGTTTLTLTVAKAALTVTASNATKVYGAGNPTFSAAITGFVNGETLATSGVTGSAALSTAATASSGVGTYAITASAGTLASSNYTFTFVPGTLSVTKAPLTVSANNASRVYGAIDPAFTAAITGFVNGETLATSGVTGTAALATTATGASGAGTYPISATAGTLAAANYAFTTFNAGTLTITKAPLTVTADDKSRIYGASNPALTATITGFVNADTAATAVTGTAGLSTTATSASSVGTYAIAVDAGTLSAANYAFTTFNAGTLTVTKAVLTVTADDKSRVYGAANPALTASVTGFVNSDVLATAVTGAAALSTTATTSSGAGTYPISADIGTLAATNYSFTFAAGTLTITKAVLTVTAEDKSRAYGASDPVFTHTVTGYLNGDTGGVITGAPAFSTTATTSSPVGTYPITPASGTLAAANYTFAFTAGVLTITPAPAQVTLGNLNQTYAGSSRTATVTTTPSGLPVTVTYNGGSTVPVSAGSYAVVATITDPNYTGSATGTLTVAKAGQVITFNVSGAAQVGAPVALSAIASSGLSVSFQVVSGNATISGSTVTLSDAGPVVVRASQAGNSDYAGASVERTISASKLSQTITFAPLAGKRSNDEPFTLSATASSGLPVSFTIISGPAMLSGSTLTLTRAAGTVVVRASQAGNAVYDAAPSVQQSFDVLGADEHQVFFGRTQGNDTVAVDLAPDGRSGTLLCYVGSTGEAFIVSFSVNADGSFEAQIAPLSGRANAPTAIDGQTVAAAVALRTFRGQLSNGTISGAIVELGLNFSATLEPRTGPTAAISGLYESAAINSANGTTASIVGTQGQVLVVAATAAVSTGGTGVVSDNGGFSIQAPGATISGSVDVPTTTVSGTILSPNQTPVNFSGLATSTLRTDRLINLSSRARIGPGAGRTLITGFVVGGTQPKRVLLRAIGPALAGFGVSGTISNPRLQLYNAAGALLVENDDWSGVDTVGATGQVGAFALTTGGRDAALVTTLAPGAYTMHVIDGGETGVALAEIYDASLNPQGEYQRLVNISSRGTVEAGDGVLVGGFVVTGNSPKKVLVRGVGPTLGGFGVAGALTDPKLTIYSGQTVIAQNNDWSTPVAVDGSQIVATATEITAAARATGAFAFAANSKDAAVIVTLAPGAYTAQVTSTDGSTGVALVEIYEIPE